MATLTSSYQFLGRSSVMTSSSGLNYYILLYAKTSVNQTTGIHTVTIKEVLASPTNNATFYKYYSTFSGKIGSSTAFSGENMPWAVWELDPFSAGGISYKEGTVIAEGSASVDCSDGLSHNINLSCTWTLGSNYASYTPPAGTSRTISVTATLPAIPRSTVVNSVTCSTAYFDGTITCKYTPQNANYYNKLAVAIDTGSDQTVLRTLSLGKKAAIQNTETITLTDSELQTIYANTPNTDTADLVCVIRTYSDSGYTAQIGSYSSKSISLSLPAFIKPAANLSVSPVNENAFIAGKGIYVQGFSGLSASVSADPGTGATIKSYGITVGSYSASAQSASIDKINASGSISVVGSATDSRDRSGSVAEKISVLPYYAPRIYSILAERGTFTQGAGTWEDGEDGNDLKITLKLSISLEEYNNLGSVSFSLDGTTTNPASGSTSGISSGVDITFYFKNINNEITHVLIVTPSDSVGSTGVSVATVIPTINVTIEYKENGKGIAFFKTSEKDGFECNGDMYLYKNLFWENPANTVKISLDSDISGGTAYTGDCWAKKDIANFVELHLRINANNSGSETVVVTLPEGYRPSRETFCTCYNTNRQLGYAYINESGEVKAWMPATGQTLIIAAFHAD